MFLAYVANLLIHLLALSKKTTQPSVIKVSWKSLIGSCLSLTTKIFILSKLYVCKQRQERSYKCGQLWLTNFWRLAFLDSLQNHLFVFIFIAIPRRSLIWYKDFVILPFLSSHSYANIRKSQFAMAMDMWQTDSLHMAGGKLTHMAVWQTYSLTLGPSQINSHLW